MDRRNPRDFPGAALPAPSQLGGAPTPNTRSKGRNINGPFGFNKFHFGSLRYQIRNVVCAGARVVLAAPGPQLRVTDELVAAPHDPSCYLAAAASKQQMRQTWVPTTGDNPFEASGWSVRRKGREKAVAGNAERSGPTIDRA